MIIEWLLDSDPSIRWQVMRDLIAGSDATVARVATFSSLARPSYRFSHRMADTESRQDRSHPSGGCVTQRINRNQ